MSTEDQKGFLYSFKHYGVFLVIALFVGSVLLSRQAGVNLIHHHVIPELTQTQKVECHGLVFHHCSVRLTSEIGKKEDYREILELLSNASSLDTVTFYLAGNGGQVDTTVQLLNAIKSTKAHTIAVVQGDVYSAHADLSISMDEMVVGDYINFIFHRSSAYGESDKKCAEYKDKTDRTKSMEQKCQNYFKAHFRVDEQLVRHLQGRYLTAAEIQAVLDGEDLIVSGDDMKQRQAAYGAR